MWHDHDIDFARWQHPTMWHVARKWHALEFAQTSAILEFYFWFRFRPYHCSRHVILHQSAKFLSKSDHPRQKKMTSCRFSRWRILGSNNGFFEKPMYATSYRSSIDTIALHCLVFEKIEFLHFGVKIQDGGSPPSWILGVPLWVLWKAHLGLAIGRQKRP